MDTAIESKDTQPQRRRGRQGKGALIERAALKQAVYDLADEHGAESMAFRPALIKLLKDEKARAWTAAENRLVSGVADGIGAAHLMSDVMDKIIAVLADFATDYLYRNTNPSKYERLGIIATGGYGRGALAPQSDIDLLFLLPYKQTPWGESVVEWLLYALWDLGLKVGHATRSVDECIRLAGTDVTIATAMLETRGLWGDEEVIEDFHNRYWTEVVNPQSTTAFVEAKLAERDARHEKMGDTRYLVEPNLKDGKGGLRDLQTLYWIGKWVMGVEEADDLVHEGVLTKSEARQFRRAEAFFMTTRCHLHFLAERPEERLTFDVQEKLAQRMGYKDRVGGRAVERFMRHYFLSSKDVGDLTRIFCAVLEEKSAKARPTGFGRFLPSLPLRGGRKQKFGDFTVQGGRINTTDEDAFKNDPVNLLRLFQLADEHDFDIHPMALQRVTRSLKLVVEKLRDDSEAHKIFLDILCSRHNPENALRRLSESGVFGRLIPEFGRVTALMQFNMYHHYTVDEHTIRAIGILSRIERGLLEDDHPVATIAIKQIVDRHVLFVAMLLHDIAKGLPGDHSEVGAEIAQDLCPRLGLAEDDTETVAWLVRVHLLMSNVAQKRDISDPKTVETFAQIVQSPERLRLLLCLTVADMRATAPGVWNGWKGQLLRDLYDATMSVLSGGQPARFREGRVAAAKDRLAEQLTDWDEAERNAYLNSHYDTYWLSTEAEAWERHARLMKQAKDEGKVLSVDWLVRTDRAATEVTIVAPDHPGMFARVAGAIALSGADIVDAKGFTTSDGRALEVFTIQDQDETAFSDKRRLGRIPERIEEALGGGVLLPEEFDTRGRITKRMEPFKVAPRVLIDNQASDIFTVIEVNGLNRLGLLYDLSRVFFKHNLTIGSAHVSSFGERAVDVFYVKDLFGQKIRHEGKLEHLEADLRDALKPDGPSTKTDAEATNEKVGA